MPNVEYCRTSLKGVTENPREDAACFDAVRTVYPEKHCVAIDFFFHSDLARVKEFLGKVSAEPMWVEDPTNYDLIHQFSAAERIAAGEKCATAEALLALCQGGVRHLILDVEYLGGPMRFLETGWRCSTGGISCSARRPCRTQAAGWPSGGPVLAARCARKSCSATGRKSPEQTRPRRADSRRRSLCHSFRT